MWPAASKIALLQIALAMSACAPSEGEPSPSEEAELECRFRFTLADEGPFDPFWWNRPPPPGVRGRDFDSVPDWVPRYEAVENDQGKSRSVAMGLHRTFDWAFGTWAEYLGHAWMPEPAVAQHFLQELRDAGFEVEESTTTPMPEHYLRGNQRRERHTIVANDPRTCRSLLIVLVGHEQTPPYLNASPPFEGLCTEIRVSFRAEKVGVR